MFPSPFEYHAPATVDETVALLGKHGPDARLLAGGQSLVAAMNLGLARPSVVVDLNRVAGLEYVELEMRAIGLGALTRHRLLERSPHIRRMSPLLSEAAALVGNARVRGRGTLGGSLAQADPAAELPAALLALEAEIRLAGPAGHRVVRAEEFFVDALTTALRPDEVLVEVRVPTLAPRGGWAFVELARRPGGWAVVGAAVLVSMGADGACQDARIALAGVGPVPVRARHAEARARGGRLDAPHVSEVADQAAAETEVASDALVSAAYRRHLIRVLVARALERAYERARTGSGQGGEV